MGSSPPQGHSLLGLRPGYPSTRPDTATRVAPPACLQGTSMATPVVAGSAALVRQYFMDGFYPSGAHARLHLACSWLGASMCRHRAHVCVLLPPIREGAQPPHLPAPLLTLPTSTPALQAPVPPTRASLPRLPWSRRCCWAAPPPSLVLRRTPACRWTPPPPSARALDACSWVSWSGWGAGGMPGACTGGVRRLSAGGSAVASGRRARPEALRPAARYTPTA